MNNLRVNHDEGTDGANNLKPKVIFFGNGPLADYALAVLEQECQVVFHARTKEDLEEVKRVKAECPEAHGVLASFGVMIRGDVLELFEPEGILNVIFAVIVIAVITCIISMSGVKIGNINVNTVRCKIISKFLRTVGVHYLAGAGIITIVI